MPRLSPSDIATLNAAEAILRQIEVHDVYLRGSPRSISVRCVYRERHSYGETLATAAEAAAHLPRAKGYENDPA